MLSSGLKRGLLRIREAKIFERFGLSDLGSLIGEAYACMAKAERFSASETLVVPRLPSGGSPALTGPKEGYRPCAVDRWHKHCVFYRSR